jgi:hypothetical protein
MRRRMGKGGANGMSMPGLRKLVYYLQVNCSILNYRDMKKMLAFGLLFGLLLLISSGCSAQVVGRVDKKTKEFSIASDLKVDYMVFGFQIANATTQKLICFASNDNVVRANSALPLGSYFDTDRLPPGAKIMYLGMAGSFGKMSFIAGGGKTTVFYLPKASYMIK